MIKLYQFPPLWGLPNASPFCMKLETYLRMAGLPYEVVSIHDPRKSPNGKLPYIKDEDKVITDSGMIIEYLNHKYKDLDAQVTPAKKTQALAIQRLLEEHLYWILVYSRWADPAYWPLSKKAFFGHLGSFTQYYLPNLVRKLTLRQLKAQGIGRYQKDQVYQMGVKDLEAVTMSLGDQLFMLGDEPTSIDASVYAFIANILKGDTPSPLQDYAKAQPNLVAYYERMHSRYFAS